jgi:integrase
MATNSKPQRDTIPIRTGPKRIRFTKRTLEGLKPPATGREYWYDEQTRSLAVCVTSTGRRTFYSVRKIDGRTVRLRLGVFPDLSIEQARKLTAKAAAAVAEGRDPQAERQARRSELTLRELFDHYLNQYAKDHKKTWQEDEAQFERYLTPWKTRRLSNIGQADVRALHAKLGRENGRYAANRLLALLSVLFNHAIGNGLWQGTNPCKGVKRFREQKRERFLQADELPRFFQALEAEPNRTIRDYFKIALLTGARRSNVLAMRWADVHLERATWEIPETKNGDGLTVHLPAAAVDILREREAVRGGSPFVFPSHGRTGHLVEPKTAWARICKAADLEGVRIHDLRRTLGSWQVATGASLPIIGKSLGHKNQNTTAIYARLNLDPVRQSVDTAVAAILAAAEPKTEGEDDAE